MAAAGVGGLGLIVVLVLTLLGGSDGSIGGVDVGDLLDGLQAPPPSNAQGPDPDARLVRFVSFVLDDVQRMWAGQFRDAGRTYQPAELVLFTDGTATACGHASSATGPFYCPGDGRVYLDLGFFHELRRRFAAPGDFAQAYVIAHEIGHHVQDELGISDEVDRASRSDPSLANDLSVRLELQADCLAGVWAHSTYERGLLEPGDVHEALDAAAAVGDDRIQESTTGRVNPETWTHGSSEQRSAWFSRGYASGVADDCDTFTGDV
jgi:predicted metalloprotease